MSPAVMCSLATAMAAWYSSEDMVRVASADPRPSRGAGTISPEPARVRAQSAASSTSRAHAPS